MVYSTHGMAGTKIHKVWKNMLQRCYNSNHPGYNNYGGRGITVCFRWQFFENFYEDMGNVPEGMMMDRINNDGNYEPDNCRWVTKQISNINKSRGIPWDNHWRGNQWMNRNGERK